MKTTPLHGKHLALKAKMAEFAGYDMPIQYEGVLAEHNWTREKAGLFDVSHMGQVLIEGDGAAAFWEKLTPSAISKLAPTVAKYTVLTNEDGGIVDDLIVTRLAAEEKFLAVLNAGCKDKDLAWLQMNLPEGVRLFHLEDRALFALQGPLAEKVLREALQIDAANLGYMRIMDHAPFLISRLGYTGEDGFEISVPAKDAAEVWDKILQHPDAKPIGLAARDSLRLEMGYPLYGHDITADTSPVEADLGWIVGKERTGYIGEETVRAHRENGPPRLRVGIRLTDKGVAREGAEIFMLENGAAGQKLGDFTSGGHSPTLNASIGQGYIDPKLGKIGDDVLVRVRGRDIRGVLASLPFVEPKTKRPKAKGV